MNAVLKNFSFLQMHELLENLFLDAPAAGETRQKKQKAALQLRNQQTERVLREQGNAILRFSYSYLHNFPDAEDILQETLIRYLQHAPQFENPAHEKAWLFRVAANLCRNRLRDNAVRNTDELDEMLAAREDSSLKEVWDAVKALESPSREVIHLFYYEGYSAGEISEILGRKESTIRSDLHRGRLKLKEILKEDYDFE